MVSRLNEIILDLKARMDRQASFGWAVVTSVTPLLIRYDAESESIAGTPARLVSGLALGDRVWCMRVYRRDVVLGRAQGAQNNVLWTGAWFMNANQQATLSQKVSEQATGIVLVWQKYTNSTAQVTDFNYTFIPKWSVLAHPGRGVACPVFPSLDNVNSYQKYIYVHDGHILGNNSNGVAPRNTHVLTTVIGV